MYMYVFLFVTYKVIILIFNNVDIYFFLKLYIIFPTHLLSTMLARFPPQSSHEQGSGSAPTSVACAVPSSASAHPIPKLTINTKTCNDHWKMCKNSKFYSKTCEHAIPNPWHAMQVLLFHLNQDACA